MRLCRGRAHAEVGRSGPDRDVVGLLEGQAQARVRELVPIRYGRLQVSAFAFYRGAALVMAHDLAGAFDGGDGSRRIVADPPLVVRGGVRVDVGAGSCAFG